MVNCMENWRNSKLTCKLVIWGENRTSNKQFYIILSLFWHRKWKQRTCHTYTHIYIDIVCVSTRLDPIQFDSIPLGQPKQVHKICQLIFRPHVSLITIFISFSIKCSSQRFSIDGIGYRNERKLTKIHWSPFKGYLLYKLMISISHFTEMEWIDTIKNVSFCLLWSTQLVPMMLCAFNRMKNDQNTIGKCWNRCAKGCNCWRSLNRLRAL